MYRGIALVAIGALGAIALGGALVVATSEGTMGIGDAVVDARIGAAGAAIVAAVVAGICFAGIGMIRHGRGRRGKVDLDARARDAEQESRAILLEMRLDQLRREVDELEGRKPELALVKDRNGAHPHEAPEAIASA